MKTCRKCKQELTAGNIKVVKTPGKRSYSVHKVCPQPRQEANQKGGQEANQPKKEKVSLLNARKLYLRKSDLETLERYVSKSMNPVLPLRFDVYSIVPEYIDLHPDEFKHLVEIEVK